MPASAAGPHATKSEVDDAGRHGRHSRERRREHGRCRRRASPSSPTPPSAAHDAGPAAEHRSRSTRHVLARTVAAPPREGARHEDRERERDGEAPAHTSSQRYVTRWSPSLRSELGDCVWTESRPTIAVGALMRFASNTWRGNIMRARVFGALSVGVAMALAAAACSGSNGAQGPAGPPGRPGRRERRVRPDLRDPPGRRGRTPTGERVEGTRRPTARTRGHRRRSARTRRSAWPARRCLSRSQARRRRSSSRSARARTS